MIVDRYHTTGTAVQQVGWKVLDLAPERRQESAEARGRAPALPPGLKQGQSQDGGGRRSLKKKTRPPKRFTEATLLTAMETAGKTLDEKELSDAMKETGLGTPATRAGHHRSAAEARATSCAKARVWRPRKRASV